MKFKVIIEEGEDGWYVVEVSALPGCISQGKTKKEALENIKEAIELYLEPEDDFSLVRSEQLAEVTMIPAADIASNQHILICYTL